MTNSGRMPFIKSEPDEYSHDPNRYMQNNNFSNTQGFGSHFNTQQNGGSIDPSELSMANPNYGSMPYNFNGGGNNMSSGFIDDSELLDSLGLSSNNGPGMFDEYTNMNQPSHNSNGAVPMSQAQMYSSTPDGPPIQSPFLGTFDYNQFRPLNSLPHHMSPHQGAHFGKRPSMQAANRKSSDPRTPLTPRTGMAGLQIGTPETTNVSNSRVIRAPSVQSRHAKNMSGQYEITSGSFDSIDSPLSSPANGPRQFGISETLGSSYNASLPQAKVDGFSASVPPSSETADAKKRRRRASHNAVERRRRDNINERIQDLSHLVPQHRLEDERVRKQLQNVNPMSPTLGATSMSPPNAATSLLAGAAGRRAASTAGNITIGLPPEDKDKGPNKGDILNGSVAWTRDLMWALHQKYQQEDELLQYIQTLGGQWPFQITDDEKRLRSEVMEAMEKNDPSTFTYTRTDGTGLRVPQYTNIAGERLQNQNNANLSPQSNFELSPGFTSGGSGTNSGSGGAGHTQYWHSAGHTGISFKEEDEFMELN